MERADWPVAIALFRAALHDNAGAANVWQRLAHAQREAGDLGAAKRSLERASELDPGDADPFRGLAHLARLQEKDADAAAQLLSVSQQYPSDFGAVLDFLDALPRGDERASLIAAAGRLGLSLPTDSAPSLPVAASLIIDVTELMVWYRSFRLASGVQRVQLGLLEALLAAADPGMVVGRFDGRTWKPLDPQLLTALLELSQSGSDATDPAWREMLMRVHMGMSQATPITFHPGSVLVSLGAWVTHAFLDALDEIKRTTGCKYIPLIYDLIPILRPEWFPASVGAGFPAWFDRLRSTADGYVAISEATKRDVVRLSATSGPPIASNAVTVMRLDADCRGASVADEGIDPPSVSAKFGLSPRHYVLLVSTIEPRKNHIVAFKAWQMLIASRGADAVPFLVCVGGRGWKNADAHRLLKRDARLRSRIKILSGVTDRDLAALYRHARFTLYPSLYEGWGLPVTESLCYGRPALVASNSALVEAGGDFVEYFDAERVDELVAVATRMIDDDAYLADRERHIAVNFRARDWRQLADDVMTAARRAQPDRGDGSTRTICSPAA